MLNGRTVGVALPGGAFRATLFSLGSLYRLNELGLLRSLDRLTGVSGGAILLGYLGARWSSLTFDRNDVCANLTTEVVEPLSASCRRRIEVLAGVGGILPPFHSAGDVVARLYDRHLFRGVTLKDRPELPLQPQVHRRLAPGTQRARGRPLSVTESSEDIRS